MTGSPERPECARCGLYHGARSPFLPASRARSPLLFVFESPSFDTDRRGGFSPDEMLRTTMELAEGIGLPAPSVTHAVRCCAGVAGAKDRNFRACRDLLHVEVESTVASRSPFVVVAFGAAAFKSMTGRTGFMASRGRAWPVTLAGGTVVQVVPCISPGYVLRNPATIDMLSADLVLAKSVLEGTVRQDEPLEIEIVSEEHDLDLMLDELSGAEAVAWDVESTGLDPFAENARLVTIQFCGRPGRAFVVPVEHDEARRWDGLGRPWSFRLRDRLASFLSEFPRFVGHNLKFDSLWVRAHWGIEPARPMHDTLILAHALDENAGKIGGNSLKALAVRYTSRGGYEDAALAIPDFYERIRSVPLRPDPARPGASLAEYAAGDVDVTLRLYNVILPKVRAQGIPDSLFALETMKHQFLCDMEFHGIDVDWRRVAELRDRYPVEIAALEAELRRFPEVLKAEVLWAWRNHPASVVADLHRSEAFRNCSDELDALALFPPDIRQNERVVGGFNFGSAPQLRILLLGVMGLSLNDDEVTASGEWSLSKSVLARLLAELPEGRPRELIRLLLRYRSLTKLFGTYIDGLDRYADTNGRIHTRYNPTSVLTWRLSSSQPNLQNLPRDDEDAPEDAAQKGDVKSLFIPPPGWLIAELDYSQIELRILALLCQDPALLDAYESGEDLHAVTGAAIARLPLEEFKRRLAEGDTHAKRTRSAAKVVNFGIVYGMTEFALSRKLRISEGQAAEMIAAHRAKFPRFWEWVGELREEMLSTGVVRSAFGHVRHLPEVFSPVEGTREGALRQGVNFPIQCTASNLCVYAGAFAAKVLRQQGLPARIVGQVHDSLWLVAEEGSAPHAIEVVRTVMENTGFGFLRPKPGRRAVPILADAKAGRNLRDLVEVPRESP